MADRATLAIHKLEEFKEWLDCTDVQYRDTTAPWQVLQVRLPYDPRWHAIYKKLHAKEHLSVPEPLVRLVREFIERPLAMHKPIQTQAAEQPLIAMNRCCEKAVPLGRATCPECEEASAGYQGSMSSNDTPPWE